MNDDGSDMKRRGGRGVINQRSHQFRGVIISSGNLIIWFLLHPFHIIGSFYSVINHARGRNEQASQLLNKSFSFSITSERSGCK